MTHDEMIAVIEARKKGKTIECKYKLRDSEWKEVPIPRWNFIDYDYRIKTEPHYRPFKNAEEVMEAIKEHGNYVKFTFNSNVCIFPVAFSMNGEEITFEDNINGIKASKKYVFNHYTFVKDGTPFGKLEE